MKITDQELKKRATEADLTLTQEPSDAIFLMRDGTGISGEMGVRGLDHNSITSLVEPEIKQDAPNYWCKVHDATDMVRLVPESNTALIMEGQPLTQAQKRAINELGATVEPYIKRLRKTIKRNVSQLSVRANAYNLAEMQNQHGREIGR